MIDIAFALGLISLLSAWHAWRLAVRDSCRDTLFDLRDDLRDAFHAADQLDTAAYADTRKLLNAMIRYTHTLSFWGLLAEARRAKRFPLAVAAARSKTKVKLNHLPSDLRTTVTRVRRASGDALAVYLVESSMLLLTLSFFILGYEACKRVFSRKLAGLAEMKGAVSERLLKPFAPVSQLEVFATAAAN